MKGNQGLEALAALCGGRPKAVARTNTPPNSTASRMTTISSSPSPTDIIADGAASASSVRSAFAVPIRLSPANTNATKTFFPSNNNTAPSNGSAEAAANQLIMRHAEVEQLTAAEAATSNSSLSESVTTTSHPPANNSNGNKAPGISPQSAAAAAAATTVHLTPQQINQVVAVAASNLRQAAAMDPAMAQSLLITAGQLANHPVVAAAHEQPNSAAQHSSSATAAPVAATPAAVPLNNNNFLAGTMQQLAIQQYLQQAQQQQQQQAAAQAATHPLFAMALATGKAAAGQQQQQGHQQVAHLPISHLFPIRIGATPATKTTTTTSKPTNGGAQQPSTTNTYSNVSSVIKPSSTTGQHHHQQHLAQISPTTTLINLASAGGRILPGTEFYPSITSATTKNKIVAGATIKSSDGSSATDSGAKIGNKKMLKRAANRRSAQLSRKRKKQFIEELKEENDDLRRKEQILRAIPDLVVVFDSSGKLGFVSESVGRFLDLSPEKLEGTSFWDLICEDSVRLLKAAFMDSLAAREPDSDTAMLGEGVWKLRLKNKHSNYMVVTLNGVVHFKGDAPECVCCIRPYRDIQQQQLSPSSDFANVSDNGNSVAGDVIVNNDSGNAAANRAVSCSDASRTSYGSNGSNQQFVISGRPEPLFGGLSSLAAAKAHLSETVTAGDPRSKKFRRYAGVAEVMASSSGLEEKGGGNDNGADACDGTSNSVRISDGGSEDGLEDE